MSHGRGPHRTAQREPRPSWSVSALRTCACVWVVGRFFGAAGSVLRLVCGLQAFFYGFAPDVDGLWRPWLRWGVLRPGRWSCPGQGQGRQAFAPNGRRDASGGACAASGLAPRGARDTVQLACCLWSRPGSLVASSLRLGVPRRAAGVKSMPRRSGGQAAVGYGMDLTPSARRGLRFAPTRRGIRDLPCWRVSGAGRAGPGRYRPPPVLPLTGRCGKTRRPGLPVLPDEPVCRWG